MKRNTLRCGRAAVFSLAPALALGLVACQHVTEGDSGGEPDGPATAELLDDGKFDRAPGELRIRAGNMTVWLDTELGLQPDGRWTLEGRSSTNLAAAVGWGQGHALGWAEVISARRFEVQFSADEVNALLSGVPLFIYLTPTDYDGPTHAVRVVIEPGFANAQGVASFWLDTALRPVWVASDVIYRGTVWTTDHSWLGHVIGGGDRRASVDRDRGEGPVEFDWEFEQLIGAASGGEREPVRFEGTNGEGEWIVKTASLRFAVAELGLTVEEPERVWPTPLCDGVTDSCLESLPIGAIDAGACGSYQQVAACGGISDRTDEAVGADWTTCPPSFRETLRDCAVDAILDAADETSVDDALEWCALPEYFSRDFSNLCDQPTGRPAFCDADYDFFIAHILPICIDELAELMVD